MDKEVDMETAFKTLLEKLEKKRLERVEQLRLSCTKSMLLVNKIKLKEIEESIEIVKQTAEEFGTDTNVGSNGWIPFVQRGMTKDEKESFGDLSFMLDCPLPDEDEEILITYKFKNELYVDVDTFMRDGSECYLDSGRDFVTEAVAWRKKPEPYQPKGE